MIPQPMGLSKSKVQKKVYEDDERVVAGVLKPWVSSESYADLAIIGRATVIPKLWA